MAMHLTTHSCNPLQDLFGGGYAAEHHSGKTFWNRSTSDVDAVIASLTVSMFGEVLKSPRTALSL